MLMTDIPQLQPASRKHTDGSLCLEGTRKLPREFAPCCAQFEAHTSACVYDVRYEWSGGVAAWQIAIPEIAGGGGLIINHCPHCGAPLAGPNT